MMFSPFGFFFSLDFFFQHVFPQEGSAQISSAFEDIVEFGHQMLDYRPPFFFIFLNGRGLFV
eukprot:m.75085 g.75085  ORF g.75085 m.75085 type:complete len:62 (-) comp13966_c0_seq3:40-225(-)